MPRNGSVAYAGNHQQTMRPTTEGKCCGCKPRPPLKLVRKLALHVEAPQLKLKCFLIGLVTSHTQVMPSGNTTKSPASTFVGWQLDQSLVGVTMTSPSKT
eukprot:4711997-Amphidinium_carterae.1